MNAYVDTSVLLRKLFGERNPLRDWKKLKNVCSSEIISIEVQRTIDRNRLTGEISDEDVEHLHQQTNQTLKFFELYGITKSILVRAGQAMPTVVGTLDAIHLATALEIFALSGPKKIDVVATHDIQLARCARSLGFEVIGV